MLYSLPKLFAYHWKMVTNGNAKLLSLSNPKHAPISNVPSISYVAQVSPIKHRYVANLYATHAFLNWQRTERSSISARAKLELNIQSVERFVVLERERAHFLEVKAIMILSSTERPVLSWSMPFEMEVVCVCVRFMGDDCCFRCGVGLLCWWEIYYSILFGSSPDYPLQLQFITSQRKTMWMDHALFKRSQTIPNPANAFHSVCPDMWMCAFSWVNG